MNSNSVICKYIFTLKAARGNRLLFPWKPTILCILSATLIPVQWWCHILWVLWCHWLTVQFVVPLLVCVGVCDADVRASASFVPPKYFYCILSVIAYRNVIKLDSNLATAQKSRPKLSSDCPRLRKTAKAHLIRDTQTLRTKPTEAFISLCFGVWSSSCVFMFCTIFAFIYVHFDTWLALFYDSYDFVF